MEGLIGISAKDYMKWWEGRKEAVKRWVRRKTPRLVWYDDEIDVYIAFGAGGFGSRDPGLSKAEEGLQSIGVTFGKEYNWDGRDWVFDRSLCGPVSVRFRSHASKPENRISPPKPKLIVDNEGVAA